MQIQEPHLRSDLSDLSHASKIRESSLIRMPVKMLGKIAMRTCKDVRNFLHKRDLPALPASYNQQLLPATGNSDQAFSAENSDGSNNDTSSTNGSGAMSIPPTNDTINNLKKVVKQSREILCSANTVILPMNFFPDTVMVDRTRITIIKRTFFWSANVISISIDDILNVSASVGPFFGSLTVSSRVMNSTDHFQIDYFWRKDALHLKHIIQGYIIAHQNNIATDQLNRDQLTETLLELGKEDHN